MPRKIKVIGFSATPERLDGKPLSDIYEKLVLGPSIPYLTECGFLAPIRYFAPPFDLSDIHFSRGDANADELDKLLKARHVYGKAVEYFKKYGQGRPALGFCRDIRSATETASQFREAGFLFEHITGEMPAKKQQAIMDGLKAGKLHGLLCADLLTYGVDLPSLAYIFLLRPTQSRALFFQMCGRGMRIAPGKRDCVIVDHCNCLQFHHDNGVPLIFSEHIEWAFYGTEKKKKAKTGAPLTLCPMNDFQWCKKPSCAGCALKPGGIADARKPDVVVDVALEEKKPPPRLSALLPEERQEVQDGINGCKEKYREAAAGGGDFSGPVAELVKIAEKLGRKIMWVYWTLADENQKTINVPLLYEICRVCGFKPGWVYYQKKLLEQNRK